MRASGREPSAEVDASQRGLLPNTEGPTAFGKYHLFAVLGRGGMADVYLAVSRGPMGFNKLVVVKRLRDSLAEEPSFLNMFLDEARLAARLNHPNVVHTYEVGEHDGHYFIAMEYLDGQSVQTLLRAVAKKGSKLSAPMCARIVADALAGLHHAHELKDYDGTPLNIIHRDVSPHNVFVTYEGQVKLVDFGIAKAALSRTQTEVGVLKGKVAYMAPEQAMGVPLDRRADLFAMGIVLWELLTGQRLMAGETAAVTLHRLLNKPVPRVSEVLPSVDPRLDAIVARALEKDPNARFATAQEMRDALEAWIAGSGALVRQEDIGANVSGYFAATRADVKRQIQEHMTLVERAASTDDLAVMTAQAARARLASSGNLPAITPVPAGGSGVVKLPPGGPAQLVAEANLERARPGRTWPLVLAVLAVLVAVGAVAGLAMWLRAGQSTSPPTGSSSAPTTEPSSVTADTASAPASASTPPRDTTPPASATAEPNVTAAPGPSPKRFAWPSVAHGLPPTAPTKPTGGAPASPATTSEGDTSGPGFLTLDTVPWTRVSEAGRSLGTTPILGVALSPGQHTLTLENPGEGIRTSLSVNIKSGERTSRRMMLKQ